MGVGSGGGAVAAWFGHGGAGRGAGWCAVGCGGGGVERCCRVAGCGWVRDGVSVWSVGADGVECQLSGWGRYRQLGDRAVGCGRQGVHLHVPRVPSCSPTSTGYVPAGACPQHTRAGATCWILGAPDSTVDGCGQWWWCGGGWFSRSHGGAPHGAGWCAVGCGGGGVERCCACRRVRMGSRRCFRVVSRCRRRRIVNYRAGVDIANSVIVQLDAGGEGVHLHVRGYPVARRRERVCPRWGCPQTGHSCRRDLLDSRALQTRRLMGVGSGGGAVAAGSVTEVQVAGRGGVPSGAVAAVLNVAVVSPVGWKRTRGV